MDVIPQQSVDHKSASVRIVFDEIPVGCSGLGTPGEAKTKADSLRE
jgi:hypothetical protein